MSGSKIIVCSHKKDFVLESELYMPLHVGKANTNVDLGFQGDDTGDNISEKNPNYCELTGLYWAWKNLKDVDYVGLCHYRRYFDFGKYPCGSFDMRSFSEDDFKRYASTFCNPINVLEGYDVILPRGYVMSHSVADAFCGAHVMDDFYILMRCMVKLYPDMKENMEEFFFKTNRWVGYNMFFAHKKWADDYCSWLFSILDEVSKYIKISEYAFQKRVFGFFSEMLLPLYCRHYGMRVKHLPLCMIADRTTPNNCFKHILLNMRLQFRFSVCKPRRNVDCLGLNNHIDGWFKIDGINILDTEKWKILKKK